MNNPLMLFSFVVFPSGLLPETLLGGIAIGVMGKKWFSHKFSGIMPDKANFKASLLIKEVWRSCHGPV
ncbi:MAG TPA: hypothetical protein VK974_08465 [Methylophilaceae bacterium]|nr:hypothetical protein [Methylophilaceae bacterium]